MIGSLFSGAGGLDMAVQAVFGGDIVWHAEIDKAASKVLAHRFPGVPNLGDISAVDWADVPAVDVLCGGFPCQDVSAAGKRAGIKQGTRSGLWSVFADAIDGLRPRFVVIENVRGLLSATAHRDMESDQTDMGIGGRVPVLRAAGAVLGDLADVGYDAQWATVAASDVGAPHRRERVFILASAADADSQRRVSQEFSGGVVSAQSRTHGDRSPLPGGATSNSSRVRCGRCQQCDLEPSAGVAASQRDDADRCAVADGRHLRCARAAHSPRNGRHEGRPESAGFVGGFDAAVGGDEPGVALLPTPTSCDYKSSDSQADHERHSPGLGAVSAHFSLLPTPEAKNSHAGPDYARMNREGSGGHDLVTALTLLCTPSASDGSGGKTSRSGGRIDEPLLGGQAREMSIAWGKYEPAIRRWESIVGPAPAPTEPNKNGNPRLSAAFSEWMMGWPAGWVTDPAIGISRNDQLRIVGNGVCPQQAMAALRFLLNAAVTA